MPIDLLPSRSADAADRVSADRETGDGVTANGVSDGMSDDRAQVDGHRVASVATEVLEVLLEHAEHDTVASSDELVRRIPVTAAAIDAAVRHLVDDGTVVVHGDGLALSQPGRRRATDVVRRHRLTERLLSDVIGLEWWKVHHEAERWVGVVSDDVEQRLLELLGDPGTCPHGNPIPGSSNRPDQHREIALADAQPGPVRVVRITETLEGDDEALQLLQNCGFLPDRDAEVQRIDDGWVLVAGSVQDAALPPHVAAHTYVEPF